jgi:hypothetical protein
MNCAVCLSTIENAANIDCGHIYHYGCIERWVELNPVCPQCKHTVTRINSQYAVKDVAPPRIGYDLTIAGYLYGPIRRRTPHTPYDRQPDLPGFVIHETMDEILEREFWLASGREEVAPYAELSRSDLRPVYTRTRSRQSKHTA